MVLRASLSIAGVKLAIFSSLRVDLRMLSPSYGSFRGTAGATSGALDIEIRIEVGRVPRTGSLATVFETDDSWTLSSDGDCCYVTLNPHRVPDQEFWTAQFARDVAQVALYCGERMVIRSEDGPLVMAPVMYPLDQILLMLYLARHEGALVHAAGVNLGGRGLIFAGKSGAGKSTLARQLDGREGIRLLSDDRIAVRKIDGKFLAYGTPWPGDQGAALNESAPLCGIYFLRHADADELVPLSPREAAERFMPVTSIPWYDPEPMTLILQFLDDLVAHVPAFELRFKPGPGVAELLEEHQLGGARDVG